jgi:hypothetical protein
VHSASCRISFFRGGRPSMRDALLALASDALAG